MQQRTKLKLFSLVHQRLRESGITQKQLANRLGKGADRVCRLLGAPGNWTLETISDLLFAIDGGLLDARVAHPLDKPNRNDNRPHYLGIEAPRVQSATASPNWSTAFGMSLPGNTMSSTVRTTPLVSHVNG